MCLKMNFLSSFFYFLVFFGAESILNLILIEISGIFEECSFNLSYWLGEKFLVLKIALFRGVIWGIQWYLEFVLYIVRLVCLIMPSNV